MKKLIFGVVVGALVFGFGPAMAQQIVEVIQGQGYGKKGPWFVSGTAADGAAVSGNPVLIGGVDGTGTTQTVSTTTTGAVNVNLVNVAGAFAAGVPTKVSLSATTSGSVCGLTAGSDYEVSCSVPVGWRHGAATPTATLDDNQLPAAAVRTPLRMPTGSTCFAFISSSAGACYVSLIPTS